MGLGSKQVLHLYKNILKESKKIPTYNYRQYALRRVKDAFRENQYLTANNDVKKAYEFGMENLEIIKRQVVIGNLYTSSPLIIEDPISSDGESNK